MAQAQFLSSTITTFQPEGGHTWLVGVALQDVKYGQQITTSLTPAEAIALAREIYAMAYDALDRQAHDDKQRTS